MHRLGQGKVGSLLGTLLRKKCFHWYVITTAASLFCGLPSEARGAQAGAATFRQNLPAPLKISLSRSGFVDGLTLDTLHRQVFWYQAMPQHVQLAAGEIALHIASSYRAGLRPLARVHVNGTPRTVIQAPASGSVTAYTVALNAADLRKEGVTIELRFDVRDDIDQRHCRDIDPTAYMRVLPESALLLRPYKTQADSIGAFLDQLPQQVDLAIPERPGIEAIHTAWHIATALRIKGHMVNVQTHLAPAHIVVMNELTENSSMHLAEQAGRPILQVAQLASKKHFAWELTPLWRTLRASGIRSTATQSTAVETIALSDILGTSLHQELTGTVQWDGYLSAQLLPQGYVPSGLELQLVAMRTKDEHKARLHVFVDNVLVRSIPLQANGNPETINIVFPPARRHEQLRLGLRIDSGEYQTNCLTGVGTPVQILPKSAIKLKREDRVSAEEMTFSMLGRRFAGSYHVYVDDAAQKNAAATIKMLTRLTERFNAQPRRAVLANTANLNAEALPQNFVWLSELPPKNFASNLSVTDTDLHVRDRSGTYKLSQNELHGVSIAALVHQNARVGLWMRAGNSGSPLNVPDALAFGAGDVAFYHDHGVLLTTNHFDHASMSAQMAEAAYTKPLRDGRNWLIAAAWILTMVIVVIVIVRSRHARN